MYCTMLEFAVTQGMVATFDTRPALRETLEPWVLRIVHEFEVVVDLFVHGEFVYKSVPIL